MIPVRLIVGILRLARLTLSERARAADAAGRPCCALALAMVRNDLSALIKYLTHQCLREEP